MFVFIVILITALATLILLTYADEIFSKIGRTGALAISRIMGVILAVIAIQFIINGMHEILLEWGVL